MVYLGRKGNWHRRWLDYRLLAELIRHQRFVSLLGGQRALPSIPEHWAGYGNPATTWMAWYARGVERSLGLPTAVVNKEYLQECLGDLLSQLEGQVRFHKTTFERNERIEHRLHLIEVLLLVATLLCCLQHLAQGIWHHHWPQLPGYLLTFFCGTFPAFGAALAGINNQGEFRRIARRSKSMYERLSRQIDAVHELKSQLGSGVAADTQLSADIVALSTQTARTMVNEVLDWRVIFQDRPLKTA